MHLDTKAFGLACGLCGGIIFLVMTILSTYLGVGKQLLLMYVDVYPFYSLSFFGSIVGFVYGAIEGFIGGVLMAWLYNKFTV